MIRALCRSSCEHDVLGLEIVAGHRGYGGRRRLDPGAGETTGGPSAVSTPRAARKKRPGPKLDLQLPREGDTRKVTRLGRLSRSVLHLVTLGADLRERGIGLHAIEQGIDISAMEGRAMFGMLSALAELQRELTVANTNDGLASARARGPGRRAPAQAHHGPGRARPTATRPSSRSPNCSACPGQRSTEPSTRPTVPHLPKKTAVTKGACP
jgi:hypothetical protein